MVDVVKFQGCSGDVRPIRLRYSSNMACTRISAWEIYPLAVDAHSSSSLHIYAYLVAVQHS
jgi:hypothetical protein